MPLGLAAAVVRRGIRREDLARVEDALRVEDRLDLSLQGENVSGLLHRQVRGFQDSDTVLAADGAAEFEDFGEESVDGSINVRALIWIIPEKIHMQVAVPRVTVGGHHDGLGFGEPLAVVEKWCHLAPRDHHVL